MTTKSRVSKKCKRNVNDCKKSGIYSLFTNRMSQKRKMYTAFTLFIVVLLIWMSTNSNDNKISEVAKISLRDIGNRLLLSSNDSTTLILPVIQISNHKYRLSFEKELSFVPDSLVLIVSNSLAKAGLPESYRVEVIQQVDGEVAYSYQMDYDREKNIIPCIGRVLPFQSYRIEIRFTNSPYFLKSRILFYVLLFMGVITLLYFLPDHKKNKDDKTAFLGVPLGNSFFFPDQLQLKIKEKKITLTSKECELLAIFLEHKNKVVKRDNLIKLVWEDNGVFVGRSLDTYVSKLRKKLKDDNSIKITNIHGVGYKLEIRV